MQIHSINTFSLNNLKQTSGNNHTDYYRNKDFITQNDSFVKSKPQHSFTGIKTMKEFRNLSKTRDIHCIYCNKFVINVDVLEDLRARGVFSGPVKNFIKEVAPYKDRLKPVILDVYENIERISKSAPNTHLSRIIQLLHQESIINLRKIQNPIFDTINEEIRNIKPKHCKEFNRVMQFHRNRLNGIAQTEEYSSKEFAYKVQRMANSVTNNRLKRTLTDLARELSNPSLNNPSTILSSKAMNKIFSSKSNIDYRLPVSNKSINQYIVQEIKIIGHKLGRDDIVNLCKNSEKMLLNKPVVQPFSNKSFAYDLGDVLKKNGDPKTFSRIMQKIKKLPSSNTNINSFITKHKLSNSDAIGYYMLYPSIGTLEHITPQSTKAPFVNKIGNWAIACGIDNNNRLDHDMEKYLKKFDANNPQVYFNDIIDITNDGIIELEDLLQMKESIYREGNKKLNITKLSKEVLLEKFKDNPQQKFNKFIELANHNLISGHDIYSLQKILRQRCGIFVNVNDLKYSFY